MDPSLIGLKRTPLPGDREQVHIDALLSPFAGNHFAFLSKWAGPADNQHLAPIPGDIGRLEMILTNQHVFAGVRDSAPPLDLAGDGFVLSGRLRELLIGCYVGTTGELGLLSFLDSPIPLPADPRGGARLQLGPLRQRNGPFTVFSLQPEVLAAVTPQLRFQQAAQPAQLRLWLDDLSQAKTATFVNQWVYLQTRETSLGNLRLMHDLQAQLHVPAKSCKEAADFLMDAQLICPLGGQYVYVESPGEAGHWTSTALENGTAPGPPGSGAGQGYRGPPLNWFRGLDLDATMTPGLLSARADILMQLPPKK
jgi:hypothetical protein